MKRWMVTLFCMAWIFLFTACDADPDVILQNEVSSEEDPEGGDSLTDEVAGAADDSSADGIGASEGVVSTESEEDAAESDSAGEQGSSSVIYVYICGAVNNPGVYELQGGDRIYQLVDLAGGLREDAAGQSVNLAQTVEDGEMVYVPTVEEAAAGSASSDVTDGSMSSDAADGSASSNEADADTGKVNINTATAAELTALNGIGDAKAAAIVAYREEHGSFGSTEEIMQVNGIAEATYNKIKDEITV
ncbi:MAG: helix-hairpin-helix domain-containing protein [Lachnospiraceae bacterium]|nr:helix-hairpin-helix domain-containing protein [Lachnospiraceae bacterium]